MLWDEVQLVKASVRNPLRRPVRQYHKTACSVQGMKDWRNTDELKCLKRASWTPPFKQLLRSCLSNATKLNPAVGIRPHQSFSATIPPHTRSHTHWPTRRPAGWITGFGCTVHTVSAQCLYYPGTLWEVFIRVARCELRSHCIMRWNGQTACRGLVSVCLL